MGKAKHPCSTSELLSWCALAVAGCICLAGPRQARCDEPPSRPGWTLVFHDEFDGASVDTSKWSLRDPWGRERNKELQAYVPDAFEVRDGILRIKAEKRDAVYARKPRHFTSGMMTTHDKFSQQFGRFEIRCRVPKGQGLWPAFWLLPEPLAWPPEIDVLEVLGQDPTTIHFTHHWRDSRRVHQSDHKEDKGTTDYSRDFHVIAVEWTAEKIRWEVDGVERFRSMKSIPRTPMYVLVNLAVGGDWPGRPNEETHFPAAFEVDYVRVYQRAGK